MWSSGKLRLILDLSGSYGIVRRYFVVNGFDGALTMLGLLTGFRITGDVDLNIVIGVCLGATVALGISGVTSAYLSESAERRRWLTKLERSMATELSDSAHGSAARLLPWLIAAVNGAAPVTLSLIIITPLWMARGGIDLPLAPIDSAITTAFACIFGLGIFLGSVGGTSWLWSGLKTLLIALITVMLILLFEF